MTKKENTKGNTRDVNAVNRVTLAISLRAQKLTWDEIATRCGFASRGAAHNAVQRELNRIVVENVDELRREEVMLLDQLHAEVWPLAIDKTNKGRLFAVDRLLVISEHRRKLMGLDRIDKGIENSNVVVIREVPNGYLGEAPKSV